MAKTAKLKKNAKCKGHLSTSVHSRAAKRASSSSINLDKSLKSLKAPVDSSNDHPSALRVHHGAGITKRKGKGKQLSKHQRLRQEKGALRAEAVMDKTEKKVTRSIGREKVVKERKSTWNELNEKIQEKKRKPKSKGLEELEGDWEDEEMVMNAEMNEPAIKIPVSDSNHQVLNPPDTDDEVL